MLKNINRYMSSLEDFDESSTEVKDETVETVDTSNVEASVEPENDVVEAADEVAQSTPTDEVKPDGDIETTDEPLVDETGEDSIPAPMATTNESAAEAAANQAEQEQQAEVEELTQQAEQIQAVQQETVDAAAADAQAIESGEELDVNGNTISGDNEGSEPVDSTSTGDSSSVEETGDAESIDAETSVDDNGESAQAETIVDEAAPVVEENEETSEASLDDSSDTTEVAEGSTDSELDEATSVSDIETPEVEEPQTDGISTPEAEEDAADVTTPEVEESIAETTGEEVAEDASTVEETAAVVEEDTTSENDSPEETSTEEPQQETESTADETASVVDVEETTDEKSEPVEEETGSSAETDDDDVIDPVDAAVEPEVNDTDSESGTPPDTEVEESESTTDEVENQSEEETESSNDEESQQESSGEEEVVEETQEDEVQSDSEESPQLEPFEEDEPDGEIPEDGEANFEEGELDIEDVDTDVTDDDVAEATKEADEAEEDADADEEEAIDATRTIEELQNEKESVEGFMEILKYGLSKESYSVQTLVMAQSKLDELAKAFGDHAPAIPSMENYGKDDLDSYYAASLESFRGFLSRIAGLKRALNEKIVKWWEGPLVNKVKKRAAALNKDADLALTKLSQSNIGSESIKGISSDLATKETNLVQAVAKDLRVTSEIAVKGIKDSERVLQNVFDVINKAVTEGGYEKTGQLVKMALNIKPAKYPNERAGDLFGGWTIEYTKEARSRDNEIEALAYTLVPLFKKVKVEDRVTTFDVTKGDLSNMLKMAKAYIALADKLADSAGSKALDDIINIRVTRNRAVNVMADEMGTITRASSWSEQVSLDDLASSMLKISQAHVDAYKFTTQHALNVAEGIISVVRKAL